MALFSSTQPSLRARILPRFPAQVIAGAGMSIVKSGGRYIFSVLSSISEFLVVDKGSHSGPVTFLVSEGSKQKLTVTGPVTAIFADWPPSGTYGEVEIELINGGLGVTWPVNVNWLVGDGSNSTTFAAMGVTLNNPGTNWVLIWTRDGGTTLWGRAA